MMLYQKMADAAKADAVAEELEVVTADQIKIEAIDWAWPGRFALGKLGLLAGMPDRGKGLIIADMAARFTRGAPWPCNEGTAPQGDVIILQQEDDEGDTLAPRLGAAGADMQRIHLVRMVNKVDGSSKRAFSLANDLPMLEQAIARAASPQFLVVDPLQAYLGKLNASAGIEVRGVLMPLVHLLQHRRIAGLGIMHFNKKTDINNAMARISDSLAFAAVSRHCFVVTDDPENERRLLVKAKGNLAPDIKALSYTIKQVHAGNDHRDGRDIYAPQIVWGYEHVEISAMQAMRAEANGTAASNQRKDAKDLLNRLLAGGGVPQKEIEDIIVEGEGISLATLKRAKRDLGIVSTKDGMNGGWKWHLPENAPKKDVPADGF